MPVQEMKSEKKWKLNRQAKALLIRHAPYTTRRHRPTADDYFKLTKISKEFLFVANSCKIYSLDLSFFSSYDQKYSLELGIGNGPSNGKDFKNFYYNFEELKKLSKWLHIGFINVNSYSGDFYKKIKDFQRVWNEVYPDAKINLYFSNEFNEYGAFSSLIKELSERIYNLKCKLNTLMKANVKLVLNECVLSKSINTEKFKKLMQEEHRIKKLKFSLCKINSNNLYWEDPNFEQNLNNFPTNFALKELEIEYKMSSSDEKIFDSSKIGSLLVLFPNLTSLRLNVKNYDERIELTYELEEAKETVEIALNQIHKLKMMLAQERPSIELEVSYDFNIYGELDGFETFDEWAENIFEHPELSKAPTHIRPAFNSRVNYNFKIANGDHFESVEDEYHVVSFKWKYKNFVGIFHMHIADNYKSESEQEESENEY